MQDSKGFIWIGTQTGLQRYDGKRFVTYLADIHNPDALQSDWIQTIFEDSKCRLWIGTTVAGACLLNRSTGRFYNFNLHLSGGAKKINGIWQFIEDNQHTIWITAFDGFYKFNEETQQFEPVNEKLGLAASASANLIALDKSGNLWFATSGGVKMLSSQKNVLFDRAHNPEHLAVFNSTDNINGLAFDKKENLWIGTGDRGNLYKYKKDGSPPTLYAFRKTASHSNNADRQKEVIWGLFVCSNGQLLVSLFSKGLAFYDEATDRFSILKADNNDPFGLHMELHSSGSLTLKEDREKNIWIGTAAGINIFNLEKPHFITYNLPANSKIGVQPDGEVSDILQTNEGDFYVSYYTDNGGIRRFDSNLNFKTQYLWKGEGKNAAGENKLWCLFQDKEGTVWAPNQAFDILQLQPATGKVALLKDSLLHGAINQIKQDAENNIWLAHDRKGLLKMEAGKRPVSVFGNFLRPEAGERRRVRCLLFDGDKIWVGTVLNGLQLFDKKTERFTEAYMTDAKDNRSISNNNVIDILSLNEDTLIVATQGGINIFDKKKKTFSAIFSKDGLPNNLVQAIVLDDNRNLWAAFASGLSKIDLRTRRITNYDENDGIVDNRFNCFSKLRDGRLAAGASKSFLLFDPKKLSEPNVPLDVTITGFTVFEKPVPVDSFVSSSAPVLLSYKENSLRIEFSSLQFHAADYNKYYYRLEGIDKNWLVADNDQSIVYHQLPPGNYLFSVKCANRDGVFCKAVTTLSIRIIPPFWERWWFLLLAAAVLGAGLYAFIRWREKSIKALETGKTRLQQLTAERYKAQLESEQITHFFSTSLFGKNDVDEVLWDVAKNLIGKLGFVDCMIYLWNADKTKMIQKAGYGIKGSLEALGKIPFDVVPGQGIVGAVMASGEPILLPDTRTDSRYRVDEMERLSEICVPIKYNEQLIGVIDSEHPDKDFFTRQHLQALTTIATLVASKIKAIEAEQRLRHQRAELADMNQQLAEVQLAALRSQMNPHFIFNALNSIKKFVIANEPANAEKYLGKFSKLIRSILDNSRSGTVTVEKELQLLKLYLDLEGLRFGSRLSYTITVSENLPVGDREIPSMLVQPFVENAMLHGIMHRQNGGQVAVCFVEHAGWLEITIEDNGVGRVKAAEYKSSYTDTHHSIGIQVATKRLEALKRKPETPAGITILDLEEADGTAAGTRVIIAVPID